MTTEDRMALLERAQQGDDDACQQMLVENAGLIWSIVKRYRTCGVEADDLYQLGCIGFIKAVKGFDITYGTQFSTYAVPKIAGEIRRFLRDDGAIKVSRTLRERSQSIYSAREKLRVQLGREPVLSELAEETGCTAGRIVPLGAMYPSPGFLTEVTYLFAALDLTEGETHPDEDEFLELRRTPFSEMLARVMRGEIEDAKTVCGILKVHALRTAQKERQEKEN